MVCLKVILDPLEWNARVSQQPTLPLESINIIFSNIRNIAKLNTTLLEDIDKTIDGKWSNPPGIGHIFSKLAPFLGIYSVYCNAHDQAIQHIDVALKRHELFSEHLCRCAEHPDFVNMQLETLLIEPVQRIPRYILLLTDILKVTPEENPDSKELDNALKQITTVAEKIDNAMLNIENTKEILKVQRKITGEFEVLKLFFFSNFS